MDYDTFEGLQGPAAGQRHAVYHAVDLNFRLKTGVGVVDAGVRLPTVNDDFAGRAPDKPRARNRATGRVGRSRNRSVAEVDAWKVKVQLRPSFRSASRRKRVPHPFHTCLDI